MTDPERPANIRVCLDGGEWIPGEPVYDGPVTLRDGVFLYAAESAEPGDEVWHSWTVYAPAGRKVETWTIDEWPARTIIAVDEDPHRTQQPWPPVLAYQT